MSAVKVLLDDPAEITACQLAEQLDARAIIVHVQSVPQAAAIARFRPPSADCGAHGLTVGRILTLVSSVVPLRGLAC